MPRAGGLDPMGAVGEFTRSLPDGARREHTKHAPADGTFVTCLFSSRGHDLKTLLRTGSTDAEISAMIRNIWRGRIDRYSDQRLEAINSDSGYWAKDYQKLEMISLGG